MSLPGRPKGDFRSAQHEIIPVSMTEPAKGSKARVPRLRLNAIASMTMLVSALAAQPSTAQTAPPAEPWQGWAFVLENDYFGRDKIHTDRWYSNGVHFAWSYRRGAPIPEPFQWVRRLGKEYLGVVSDSGEPTAAGFFGQNIYTPNDIEPSAQQIFDRPYAALLGIGVSSFAYFGDAHRAVDLRIGVVGPAAGGEEIQSGFHKLINNDLPNGWGLQVRPRLALQASYMHTERFRELPLLPSWAAVHWHGRVTAGTVRNLASTGLTFVAGERDRVFGAPDEGDFFAVDFNERKNHLPVGSTSWLKRLSFIAQVQVSAVASNYLIEGRTYGPQPQVHLRRGTWMATLGTSVRLSDGWRMEYRVKRRSSDFKTAFPGPNDRAHSYGEVRLVKDFEPGVVNKPETKPL